MESRSHLAVPFMEAAFVVAFLNYPSRVGLCAAGKAALA